MNVITVREGEAITRINIGCELHALSFMQYAAEQGVGALAIDFNAEPVEQRSLDEQARAGRWLEGFYEVSGRLG